MAYKANTGGTKEFHYTDEDLERIRNTDTKSTREFKDALREWREKQEYKKMSFFSKIKFKLFKKK